MSYEDAFAAVPGCKVEWCDYFGSYQGRLCAKLAVEGEEGPRYILDYYGSCSGCDSFEAEFSYANEPTPEKLAEFGKPYVEAAMTLDQALAELLKKPGDYVDEEERQMAKRILQDYPGMEVKVSIFRSDESPTFSSTTKE